MWLYSSREIFRLPLEKKRICRCVCGHEYRHAGGYSKFFLEATALVPSLLWSSVFLETESHIIEEEKYHQLINPCIYWRNMSKPSNLLILSHSYKNFIRFI